MEHWQQAPRTFHVSYPVRDMNRRLAAGRLLFSKRTELAVEGQVGSSNTNWSWNRRRRPVPRYPWRVWGQLLMSCRGPVSQILVLLETEILLRRGPVPRSFDFHLLAGPWRCFVALCGHIEVSHMRRSGTSTTSSDDPSSKNAMFHMA